jgi:acyl-CoA reductase-like NAD-dependent aldehyde dehydrogenase
MNNLLPQVSDFLASQPLKMYINGHWIEAVSGDTFETRDPGEGRVLANISAGDEADVNAAVAAAQQALQKSGWATMPTTERSTILHRLANLIDDHREIISQIESLDRNEAAWLRGC